MFYRCPICFMLHIFWCFTVVLVFYITDVLLTFYVTDVLLKCHGELPGHTDIMSWCFMLQISYWCSVLQVCCWSVMWIAWSHWHCHVLMFNATDVLLMFCVTDVLLKCHGELPGHTDIVMSCAFSPSGDILASGYVCGPSFISLVVSFFLSFFFFFFFLITVFLTQSLWWSNIMWIHLYA